jgi:hypothetical protein
MRRTGQGGLDGLKHRSEKCEGPGGGGLDGLKNHNGKCERPGRWGDQRLFEITHVCIMHRAHTNIHIYVNNVHFKTCLMDIFPLGCDHRFVITIAFHNFFPTTYVPTINLIVLLMKH